MLDSSTSVTRNVAPSTESGRYVRHFVRQIRRSFDYTFSKREDILREASDVAMDRIRCK